MLASCVPSEQKTIVPIIDNIPSMAAFAKALNKAHATSAKWSIQEGKIQYTIDDSVNWEKEFGVFINSNVNNIRYRDAFEISDETVGKVRTIVFLAKEESQETQRWVLKIEEGKIIYCEIEKNRQNLLSNSNQSFVYDYGNYHLDVDQNIEGVFHNQQYVHGTVVENGNIYRGVFDLGEKQAPIQVHYNKTLNTFFVKNGAELIGFNQYSAVGDTLVFESDFFDSRFHVKPLADGTLSGRWINDKREESSSLPFIATKNLSYRFHVVDAPTSDISGSHKAFFYDKDGNIEDTTILKLKQEKHVVTGSFLTETGDYRFLEGVVRNDSLLLSTMDGTHVYLVKAAIENGHLKGTFYSGCCYQQAWSAELNSSFELRNPETITAVLPDHEISFSFPDENGKLVSLSDAEFANKPVVISLMGTWCSNCLDEAQFLQEAEALYGNQGLKIIGLDFELIADSTRAMNNIKRHRESLGIDYPVLLACLSSSKDKALAQVPFLNAIYSYPTMLVLDKNHEVVKIHTGFNGPATGADVYDNFREEYLALFNSLLKE